MNESASPPEKTPGQAPGPEFDAFLSYASEDRAWCGQLAERLRNEGIRVWFDQWQLQAGDHLEARINDGLEKSRKLVAVWSPHYFRQDKIWTLAETYSRQHADVLAADRPIIPLLIEECSIKPTLQSLVRLDFRNPDDFDLLFRQLIEALDLPRREIEREFDNEHLQHDLPRAERGRAAHFRGKRFEDEVATLYRILGFDVTPDTQVDGVQIDLQISKRDGGMTVQAVVECKHGRVTAKERDQLLAQQAVAQRKMPRHRWIVVSAQGFAADTRTALETTGFDCITYPELLGELVPLDTYNENLITEYEQWVHDENQWNGRDLFIRPDLETDITYECRPALRHIGKWLGDADKNLMVVLGDLGTGKTTLARFVAYQMARSFRDDPLRHPAPVLIPLREVRKEVALDSIVIKHLRDRGLAGVDFRRFEHLVRQGKIVVFFDAFDPQGTRLASGSYDHTVKLWEMDSDRLVRTLKGHQGPVYSVAFDPQGSGLASGSDDHTVKLWEVASGRLLRTLEGHVGPVRTVCFAPDGRYLVAAGNAGRLQFWDVEQGETFLYLYSFGPGAWLALLPNGRFDGSPEALRYLCYTERNTLNSLTAEELVDEFHDPQAVKDVLAKYQVSP